jgi:hypothetical protein
MSFGDAIKELKLGKRLQRTGWNGKGLFIYLVPAASYPAQTGAPHLARGRDGALRLTWPSRTWTRQSHLGAEHQ